LENYQRLVRKREKRLVTKGGNSILGKQHVMKSGKYVLLKDGTTC